MTVEQGFKRTSNWMAGINCYLDRGGPCGTKKFAPVPREECKQYTREASMPSKPATKKENTIVRADNKDWTLVSGNKKGMTVYMVHLYGGTFIGLVFSIAKFHISYIRT